jgi:hypothetical protein
MGQLTSRQVNSVIEEIQSIPITYTRMEVNKWTPSPPIPLCVSHDRVYRSREKHGIFKSLG